MFLARVVPLISLFISGAWAQVDMAQCNTGHEWVRTDLRFFKHKRQGDVTAQHSNGFLCAVLVES